MGRETLGVFQSTPLGTVVAKSGLAPAQALLDHRQASFAQRLLDRPRGSPLAGPEETMAREGAALADRLRTSTSSGSERGQRSRFRTQDITGRIVVEETEGDPPDSRKVAQRRDNLDWPC